VDDIINFVETIDEPLQLAKEAGFVIKHWHFEGEAAPRVNVDLLADSATVPTQTIQVLGVGWKPVKDKLTFETRLNFSIKKRGIYSNPDLTSTMVPEAIPLSLTHRTVLEQVMRIYDPLGLLSPFLLKAKLLLRETWELKLGRDDALPEECRARWITFFQGMFELQSVDYERCLKPQGAVGKPTLVIFSDASDKAYGFSAYIRWLLKTNTYWCRLILSKSRVAPIKRRLSTPQLELNGAVLSKKARKVIEKEMRYDFERVYQLVDSKTVLCMTNKVTTRFRLFEEVRVGDSISYQ